MTDVIQERIKSLEQRLAVEPQSPLFARLASYYLQAGRASDALRLCDDGLAIYPFYSTAHLVKGKALIELDMLAEAKHEYEVVHELLPTNESLALLATSINLGSAEEPSVAGVDELTTEPEVTTASPVVEEQEAEEPQAVAEEEIPQQESTLTDGSFAPAATLPAPEPLAEKPQVAAPEDSFGAQTPLAYESEQVPPSGYETPGFGKEEQPAPADVAFTPATEVPPVQEAQTGLSDYGFGTQQTDETQPPQTDYGFGAPEEAPPIAPIVEEAPSVPEAVEPPQRRAAEDAFGVPTVQPVSEQPFEMIPATSEPPKAEAPPSQADQTPDWFDAFSQLQQPAAETTAAPPVAPTEEENPFAVFGTEEAPTAAEGESFDEFAARTRMELFGTEDTMTLDQYLGRSASSESPASPDQIGELAEKLKTSPRITPPVINYSEKAPRPGTETDVSSGSGFVTPTLAEIYVKQGWFDDAIKAYRVLITNKPAEKEKFEQRILEIEEMKRSSSK